MIVWAQHIACMRVSRNVYNIFVKKAWTEETFGRPRQISEYNIKIDIQEMCWLGLGHGLDLSSWELGQAAGCCEHGNEKN